MRMRRLKPLPKVSVALPDRLNETKGNLDEALRLAGTETADASQRGDSGCSLRLQ